MAKRKSSTVGPMSVQPNDRTYTARDQRAQTTIGEDKQTPLPKDQQARMADVRAAKARTRRSSLRKQREAQKELIALVDACSVWNQSPGRNR